LSTPPLLALLCGRAAAGAAGGGAAAGAAGAGPPCSLGQQFLQHYLDNMGALNTFG
jgi:hypothetical protein